MDRDTKHFAIVAAIVGILLTLTMLYYANKSDRLVDDYADKITLNLEKTGWAREKERALDDGQQESNEYKKREVVNENDNL